MFRSVKFFIYFDTEMTINVVIILGEYFYAPAFPSNECFPTISKA
jgi:hypothetical protein